MIFFDNGSEVALKAPTEASNVGRIFEVFAPNSTRSLLAVSQALRIAAVVEPDFVPFLEFSASMISSMQDAQEIAQTMRACEKGELKLLYVAPERLKSEAFIGFLQRFCCGLSDMNKRNM